MSLIPMATRAESDQHRNAVRFLMKDGGRPVPIIIFYTALERIGSTAGCRISSFDTFKRNRKLFERVARDKYVLRNLESDGSIFCPTRGSGVTRGPQSRVETFA